MKAYMKISEVIYFAWFLSSHVIAMATGNSSLRQVSTVTNLLSFISVARETQPWLIDGMSAMLQQLVWEVGLLAKDFQPPPHTHTQKPPASIFFLVQKYTKYPL